MNQKILNLLFIILGLGAGYQLHKGLGKTEALLINSYDEGIRFMREGKYERAIENFDKVINLSPENPAPHFGKGWALQSMNQNPEANKSYQTAITLSSDVFTRSQFNKGVIHYGQKQLKEAIGAYEFVIKINPDFTGAQYNLGFAYEEIGKKQEALHAFISSIQVEPENLSTIYNAGRISEALNKISDATKFYKQCLNKNSQYTPALERLAQLEKKFK